VDEVEGRRIRFSVEAHDGVERIGEGTHDRFVIDPVRFRAKVARKAGTLGPVSQ
jgi:fluoroacetyl-CoA thioesterase